jgi:heme o synthase
VIKAYYILTKPGIVYSNALTAIAGFFLAARGMIDIWLFLPMLFGISLVIASACVFNNFIDRNIDAKMARTQKRALVKKTIPEFHAIIFASVLGFIGFFLLLFYTNFLTAFIAFIGFIFYIIIYGIGKRRTIHGTIIGSISGAVPPVVGYCAVTNNVDLAACLLFIILVVWQMPHFYAIAIFRSQDYAAASLPVLTVKKGNNYTKIHMLIYSLLFIPVVDSLTTFHYTGHTYIILMTILGVMWVLWIIRGFNYRDENRWARTFFFFSLLIIVVFSLLLICNSFLP